MLLTTARKDTYPSESMLFSLIMAFRASELAEERRKEEREREIKVVLGISEENAPLTSKAQRLLKDGSNRLRR